MSKLISWLKNIRFLMWWIWSFQLWQLDCVLKWKKRKFTSCSTDCDGTQGASLEKKKNISFRVQQNYFKRMECLLQKKEVPMAFEKLSENICYFNVASLYEWLSNVINEIINSEEKLVLLLCHWTILCLLAVIFPKYINNAFNHPWCQAVRAHLL